MARVKRGVTAHARHKKVLKAASGFYGRRKNTIRAAKAAVDKAGQYAYRDRRAKKRSFRALWIQRINAAVRAEDARWKKNVLTVDKQLVGDRPAGGTPETSPLVRGAVSVTKALGLPVNLGESSTDANLAMNRGIPAITIDGGGGGSGSHALDESFDTTDSWKGSQRALLVCLALAEK